MTYTEAIVVIAGAILGTSLALAFAQAVAWSRRRVKNGNKKY